VETQTEPKRGFQALAGTGERRLPLAVVQYYNILSLLAHWKTFNTYNDNNEYGQIGMTYIRSTYFCGFVFGNAHMKHSHAKQTLVCSSGGYVYSLESIRVISM